MIVFQANAQTDTLAFNKSDAQGKKQGSWQKKHPNGKIRYSGQFLNDIPVGEFRYFFSNGKLNAIVNHKGNGIHASTSVFNEAGDTTAKGFYFSQQKDSIWNYYDKNHKIISTELYHKGLANGCWVLYYPGDTLAAEKTSYKNGKKQGDFIQYFSNGSIKVKGQYQNDILSGVYRSYYPDGKALNEGRYTDGLADGLWKYYTNDGRLKREEWLKKGELLKEEIYIPDEPIVDKPLDPSLDPEKNEGF